MDKKAKLSSCFYRGRIGILLPTVLLIIVTPILAQIEKEPEARSIESQMELSTWLDENGSDPVDFVVNLFKDHDVVFLGEAHWIKHDVEFVRSIMKPLHNSGVHVIATEFARRIDQPLIDRLLKKREWDEELANEIMFQQYAPWGFEEYRTIFKEAWKLNQTSPPGTKKFRIIGINNSPEWHHIKTLEDRDSGKVMRNVWHGETEENWAEPILGKVREGERVLVYAGIHHAFTTYRQPVVLEGEFFRFGDLRCGNYVYQALGERAYTVFLHSPWPGKAGYGSEFVHPADGRIDALMLAKGSRPVGFDLREGPFGKLTTKNAVYQHGYDKFTISDFSDGWIYTKPVSEYETVKTIPNWIHSENIEQARLGMSDPSFRDASISEFRNYIQEMSDNHKRWQHLK